MIVAIVGDVGLGWTKPGFLLDAQDRGFKHILEFKQKLGVCGS